MEKPRNDIARAETPVSELAFATGTASHSGRERPLGNDIPHSQFAHSVRPGGSRRRARERLCNAVQEPRRERPSDACRSTSPRATSPPARRRPDRSTGITSTRPRSSAGTWLPAPSPNPSEIATSYVTEPIYQGEQMSLRRFGTAGSEGSARPAEPAPSARSRSTRSPSQVLAGALKTGDQVDVVGTWSVPEGSSHHVSRIVLRDILVLDAPGTGDALGDRLGRRPTTVTVQLRVTDTQASKLFFLVKNGEWSLMLRPPAKAGDSPRHSRRRQHDRLAGRQRGRLRRARCKGRADERADTGTIRDLRHGRLRRLRAAAGRARGQRRAGAGGRERAHRDRRAGARRRALRGRAARDAQPPCCRRTSWRRSAS